MLTTKTKTANYILAETKNITQDRNAWLESSWFTQNKQIKMKWTIFYFQKETRGLNLFPNSRK